MFFIQTKFKFPSAEIAFIIIYDGQITFFTFYEERKALRHGFCWSFHFVKL